MIRWPTQKDELSLNIVHYISELNIGLRLNEHNLLNGNAVLIFTRNIHFYVLFGSTAPFCQDDEYDIFY